MLSPLLLATAAGTELIGASQSAQWTKPTGWQSALDLTAQARRKPSGDPVLSTPVLTPTGKCQPGVALLGRSRYGVVVVVGNYCFAALLTRLAASSACTLGFSSLRRIRITPDDLSMAYILPVNLSYVNGVAPIKKARLPWRASLLPFLAETPKEKLDRGVTRSPLDHLDCLDGAVPAVGLPGGARASS